MILILVFGLLQAVAAVTAVLLAYGLIKLAPRPAVPHPAAGYPPTGGFQGQQGQPSQATHPQQGQQPATTFMQPPPQSTQFMGQPGQFNNPYHQTGDPE
jgi:hypothetical protein